MIDIGCREGALGGRPRGVGGGRGGVHVEIEVRVRALVARGEEQFVLLDRAGDVEAQLIASEVRHRGLKRILGQHRLVLQESERRAFPLVRAALAFGADHVGTGPREFRVVRIEVHAEVVEPFLRQRRTGLAESDDVAVEETLHFHAVHVDVEETKVGCGAA